MGQRVMDKQQIQKVFQGYIAKTLQDGEVWHLRYQPKNPREVELDIEGLDLHLSDYTEALALNDFSDFEGDGARFIETQFPTLHSVPRTDELYQILLREYVKAEAHCIKVALKRMTGDYFDEQTCDWMPQNLIKIKGIKMEVSGSDTTVPVPGRPPRKWSILIKELHRRDEDDELTDKSRTTISKELADWYNKHDYVGVQPETIRKRLKYKFDELGISAPG